MPQVTIDQAIQIAWDHHRAGRVVQAETIYRRILAGIPDQPETLHLLGVLCCQTGRAEAAIALLERAVSVRTDWPEARSALGFAYQASQRHRDALAAFQAVVALQPDSADAHNNLGTALQAGGRLDVAIASFRRAIELRPDHASAMVNLGVSLRLLGQVDQAVACLERAVAVQPDDAKVHSELLLTLHYHHGHKAAELYEAHRQWNRQHAEPLRQFIRPYSNDRSPGRRLRIGYVSPDLCNHSVARFLLPLLTNHDHAAVEVFCYASVAHPDDMTARLTSCAHHWRDVLLLGDHDTADLIRRDQIDILVDLAGHTSGHRLLVFAQHPAPVQVSYLGYPNTTGMDSIDYRLTDALADPPGTSDAFCTERLVRLPETAWCFHPVSDTRLVAPPPCLAREYVTFGTLNNFAKVSPTTLELWVQILRRVPASHLLLKGSALHCPEVATHLRTWFATQGVSPDRIDLAKREPTPTAHLQWYDRIDIALDTFPYHGTTTTCEALWMGVPVVTLAGPTHVSRVGVSLLSSAGLQSLVAQSAQQYVDTAVTLAGDSRHLNDLRSTLRQRLADSPVMNASQFAHNVEQAYRAMWQQWCATPSRSA